MLAEPTLSGVGEVDDEGFVGGDEGVGFEDVVVAVVVVDR